MYIYRITNLINGKSYYGRAKSDPMARWKSHKRFGRAPISMAIRRYGPENFRFEIVLDTIEDEATLNLVEKNLIRLHHTRVPCGYNVAEGGESGPGLSGDNHWSRKYPARRARGDRHGSRTHPESILRGERVAGAKLTWKKVGIIRFLIGTTFADIYWSQRKLARRFGVTRRTIIMAATGKTW